MPEIFDWPAAIKPAAEARLSVRSLDAQFQSPFTGQSRYEASDLEGWVYELSWDVMTQAEGWAMETLLMQLRGRRNRVRVPVWHQAPHPPHTFTVSGNVRARVLSCVTAPQVGALFTVGDSLKRCLSPQSAGKISISPLLRSNISASPATTVAPYGLFSLMDSDATVVWDGCEPSCDLSLVEAF